MTGQPSTPPRKSTTLLLALLMAATGLVMTFHGLGLVSAAWAHPNPRTPQWVFTLIGIMLLPGAWLTYTVNRKASSRSRNAAGYSFIALAFVLMHWLVFFSQGGECGISTGSFGLFGSGFSDILCRGAAGIAVIVLDMILLAAAIASLMQKHRT